ncbi:MAG: dTDP-4-dehydrorhamnose 3,5-epimerase, partial [Opitutae bacterium]|nr:dTDP-4-dehydrorhamnose 3,5-epimerase [Opitutae bacterium]
SFCQWFSYECDGDNRLSIIVPQGCASAYLTLKPDTWILYYHSEFYMPGYEMGIRYNDRYFDFEWPEEPVVISDKDNSYPDYHLGNFLDRFSDR